MRKRQAIFYTMLAGVFLLAGTCLCDTFTNSESKEQLHGYIRGQSSSGKAQVQTKEKGLVELNLGEWSVVRDKLGRNNKVIVLPIDDAIMLEIETDAFEQAIAESSDEGPLLILVEIDTPGGRVDLAIRMCSAITKTENCDVIAFITGGQYSGAISAGAAVALACDKIYMANNTVIGAATLVTLAKTKEQLKEKRYEDVINEKSSSIWRAFLASLAQQNNRPGLLARAMVDNSIEVVEVKTADKRLFVEPANKKPDEQLVRTWSKAGSLLTLTAEEAVDCTIADGLVKSRQELLHQLNADGAEVVINGKMADAKRELDIVFRNVDKIRNSLDLKIKQSQYPQPLPKVLAILRGAKDEFKTLIRLAEKYPDLNMDVVSLQEELNSVNATYEKFLRERKGRK